MPNAHAITCPVAVAHAYSSAAWRSAFSSASSCVRFCTCQQVHGQQGQAVPRVLQVLTRCKGGQAQGRAEFEQAQQVRPCQAQAVKMGTHFIPCWKDRSHLPQGVGSAGTEKPKL
jgi:hypothetical protein